MEGRVSEKCHSAESTRRSEADRTKHDNVDGNVLQDPKNG